MSRATPPMDLAEDERTVLHLIARRERALLDATTTYLDSKGHMTRAAREAATRALTQRGLAEPRIGSPGTDWRYRLTAAGWAIAGNPPLHMCHPATQEAPSG